VNVNVWEVADDNAALVRAKQASDARDLESLADPAVDLKSFVE